MDEKNYWLIFSVFPGVGPTKFSLLLNKFGTAKDAWGASLTDLKNVIGDKLSLQFEKFKREFSIENYLQKLKQKEVWFTILSDENYPSLLKQIKNPPFVLYGKGNPVILGSVATPGSLRDSGQVLRSRGSQDRGARMTTNNNDKYIAIVGTRKITDYGREVTKMLTTDLVTAGFTIVSGLAVGVDAVAHQTAIDSRSSRGEAGKTIAVLGCGVDCCSPAENFGLYENIIGSNGCVVSEIPLSMPPSKGSFPSRNRIIAGLSIGVIVTEGAEDSGALYTAEDAFENNRKVFAVPGQITSQLSKGPLNLINKGAKLITSAGDILQEFKIQPFDFAQGKNAKVKGETVEEQKILDALQNEPLHFDQLVRLTSIDSGALGSLLSMMEIKGMVKGLNNGVYSI